MGKLMVSICIVLFEEKICLRTVNQTSVEKILKILKTGLIAGRIDRLCDGNNINAT